MQSCKHSILGQMSSGDCKECQTMILQGTSTTQNELLESFPSVKFVNPVDVNNSERSVNFETLMHQR